MGPRPAAATDNSTLTELSISAAVHSTPPRTSYQTSAILLPLSTMTVTTLSLVLLPAWLKERQYFLEGCPSRSAISAVQATMSCWSAFRLLDQHRRLFRSAM